MKSKFIFALIVVFALAFAVYSLNQNHSIHLGNADCCMKKGDLCPMKDKRAKSDDSQKGENCPMKAKVSVPGRGVNSPVKDQSSESDKMSCDSCPMKEKTADSDKTSCHDDCPMKAIREDSSTDECPMKKMREQMSTEKP